MGDGVMAARIPVQARIMRRVDQSSPEGCWIYQGAVSIGGYGYVWSPESPRPMVYAHRAMYEALVGPIPEGLRLDHICHTAAVEAGTCDGGVCRHRPCVNPAHLQPITHRENILRGLTGPAANARKTHCQNGHPFSGPNLVVRKTGIRECRTCTNANRRKSGTPTVWPGEYDSIAQAVAP